MRRIDVRSTGLTAAVVALAGAPFGLLWALLAPDVPLVMTERGPFYADAQPEQLLAADAWFALLGVPFGGLLAGAVWLLARAGRGVPGLLALTVGAGGAALAGWQLGRRLGRSGYEQSLAAAEPGELLTRPPDLAAAYAGWWPPHLLGVLLVPALSAAVTYTLLAAWSAHPNLHPDAAHCDAADPDTAHCDAADPDAVRRFGRPADAARDDLDVS